MPPSPISFRNYLGAPLSNQFYFSPITSSDVESGINSLKNKNCDIENIPNRIYKLCAHIIAPPLANLFNQSINEGIYPDVLKIAKLTPIYKASGDRALPSNYRPISILPTVGKIFEKVIYKQLINYLNVNNILSPTQFGFREGHSTCDAVTSFLEKIYKNLNEKKTTIAVFIDLSKAFDTVPHDILSSKLSHYGIRDSALKWFKSYLSDRGHYIKIENCSSEINKVAFGVPQGSILGPILFLIYINDFSKCHDAISFNYADDKAIIKSGTNTETLYEATNSELNKIYNWLLASKLSLNAAKSVYMVISNKKNIAKHYLYINDFPIKEVNETKFLGLTLDNKLTFKSHIKHVVSKVAKITYIIYRIKSCVPSNILLQLYNTLAFPHMNYNITVWGSASETALMPLIVQQKRLIRLLCGSQHYLSHTSPMFKELKLLKLNDIYKFNISIYMYRILKGEAPGVIVTEIDKNQNQHSHATRQDLTYIKTPQYNLEISRKALSYKGPHIWNGLHLSVRVCQSLHSFKKKLKLEIISNYGH